ncbi:hypothetical protein SUGI_0188530 [Cryptomeria japonica]|nr:hypothetical protein SUGI_0188530 [Cryptomeria japonica]
MHSTKQVTYTHHLASSTIDIRFTELPDVDFHNEDDELMRIEAHILKYMEKGHTTAELSIPTYVFFTCIVCFLFILLRFPKFSLENVMSFKYKEEYPINVPGVTTFSTRDLLDPSKDKSDEGFQLCLFFCSRLSEVVGFLINSFDDLEWESLEALREDQQPPSTIVYLSFGSGGFLLREQIAEVEHGLETSGH